MRKKFAIKKIYDSKISDDGGRTWRKINLTFCDLDTTFNEPIGGKCNMASYELKKIIPKNEYFEVIIKADSNDGDYITTIEKYEKDDFEKIVSKEFYDLLTNYSGRHKLENYVPTFGYLYVPTTEYGDYCHTLVEATAKFYDCNGCIYEVVF